MLLCSNDVQDIIPEVHVLPCHVLVLITCEVSLRFCVSPYQSQHRWRSLPPPTAPRPRPGGNLTTSSSPSNVLFCPQSTSVTAADCVRLLHLPPLSPPLCPAVCLSARSSQGSLCCPDAANQPCKKNRPAEKAPKAAFSFNTTWKPLFDAVSSHARAASVQKFCWVL